uniref:Venom peptide Tv1 n=1 Tax=Terebra variegata TaxID=3244988 RepID=T3A_TERVA|nr:RecName: Full=Venom peptide Tv1; AltName: Full=Teretoxin v3a [Terebra variegata]2MIX_A Chain A, venom peptide toxin [Terebridae]
TRICCGCYWNGSKDVCSQSCC